MLCLPQIFLYVPGYLNSILKKAAGVHHYPTIPVYKLLGAAQPRLSFESYSFEWGGPGETLAKVELPSRCSGALLWLRAALCPSRAGGCRWLQGRGGAQALLPWHGMLRHPLNLCLCLVGWGVSKLRGLSAWFLGLTEVWCDGLLWLFLSSHCWGRSFPTLSLWYSLTPGKQKLNWRDVLDSCVNWCRY